MSACCCMGRKERRRVEGRRRKEKVKKQQEKILENGNRKETIINVMKDGNDIRTKKCHQSLDGHIVAHNKCIITITIINNAHHYDSTHLLTQTFCLIDGRMHNLYINLRHFSFPGVFVTEHAGTAYRQMKNKVMKCLKFQCKWLKIWLFRKFPQWQYRQIFFSIGNFFTKSAAFIHTCMPCKR